MTNIDAQKQEDGTYHVSTDRGPARIYKEGRSWYIDWPNVRRDQDQKYTTLTAAKDDIANTLEEFAAVDRAKFKRELALANKASPETPAYLHEMEGGDTYPYASPWIRFVGAILDGVISNFTLFIGWAIWALFTAQNAQTPGKMMVNVQVIDDETGQPATFAKMFFMRGLVAGLFGPLVILLTLGVFFFMPFWDKRNRTIFDAISGTHVIKKS